MAPKDGLDSCRFSLMSGLVPNASRYAGHACSGPSHEQFHLQRTAKEAPLVISDPWKTVGHYGIT